MPDNSRVSATIHAFDNYINTTDAFLQAKDEATSHPHWQRLGLSSQNAADWHSKRLHWRDSLFKKHKNSLERTVAVTKQVTDFRADFKKFASRLLDKIAVADAADVHDENVFNLKLKKNRSKPSYHRQQITEGVMIDVEILRGGMVKVSCRTSHDRAPFARGNCQ